MAPSGEVGLDLRSAAGRVTSPAGRSRRRRARGGSPVDGLPPGATRHSRNRASRRRQVCTDWRSDLNAARISPTKSSGCSQAAK